MARRHREHERYEKKIEHRQWVPVTWSFQNNSWSPAGTKVGPASEDILKLQLTPPEGTILRLRGEMAVAFDFQSQSTADYLNMIVGWFPTFSEIAQVTDALADVNPLNPESTDFFAVTPVACIVATQQAPSIATYEVDSKAMRKFERQSHLCSVVGWSGNLSSGQTLKVQIAFCGRVLIGY